MTHDVETSCGANFCPQLMDLDDSFGIKSSFQVVPEDRYDVPPSFLENIRKRGFEVNVHDLNHDGRLFSNRVEFLRRAGQINSYGQQWGAVGFRSAILYRNIDWYDALDFSYDMSIPNVARLDPQPGGCCTVLPYFIGNIVELPVTTTQDYSLFHILHDYSIRLWKEQVSLIQEKHGLISFIIHPDYIISATARRVYVELLAYLSELRSQGATWIALPRQAAAWWRLRSELNLVNVGGSWRIEGRGSERARIAYAVVVNDTLTYEIDQVSTIRRSEMTNISGKALERTIYTDGTYLEKNPDWHMYESPFKVNQILRMLKKHRLQPKTIAEVGCGAGEVLRLLQEQMDRGCRFSGYDISPQALEMCKSRANERLQFKLADITHQENIFFDMILVLDVIEHVEDYFSFLRGIRPKSDLKIFHFPLDISVQAVLRRRGLLKRRELYGHIHYFTKETALATVKDSGYELMDYFYTPRCIELAKDAIQKIARLPRIICFSIHPDLAVRILGGYSLLILAR